jgi:replicative DNA helicase
MSPPKVARRIACNLFDITTEEYDILVESQQKVMQSMKRLINNSWCPLGKLFIKEFPTSQGTTLDIERYVKEIEETQKFKVDVVIVDYINILSNYRNPNDASNTYMKIKTIAEDLRGLAVKMDFVCITASQVGRSALNSSDINIEDVSESMGLMHSVDNALGIIMTDDMRVGDLDEDGKAQPYYFIKLLKIREGENRDQKFRVNANFSKMKFIEKTDSIDMLSHFK